MKTNLCTACGVNHRAKWGSICNPCNTKKQSDYMRKRKLTPEYQSMLERKRLDYAQRKLQPKICPECGAEHRTKGRSLCRPCITKKDRARIDSNPELKTKLSAYSREWAIKNKDKIKSRNRERWLCRAYGMTTNEYNKMLESQSHKCACCGTDEPGGVGKKLHVDHCHKTGKVRQLLCSNCNTIIGIASEDPKILRAAADYVEKWNSSVI